MKKLFNLFAIAAVVLGMASCGDGNNPGTTFQIDLQQIVGAVHVTVTPTDNEAYFFSSCFSAGYIEKAGGARNYVMNRLLAYYFDELLKDGIIRQAKDDYIDYLQPEERNEDHIIIVCYVEKSEDGYGKIIGDVVTKTFKPTDVMPGEFSVSADKKVQFAKSNYIETKYGFDIEEDQWYCLGAKGPNTPYDLHPWTEGVQQFANDFYVPSADEWWYLFKERPHADELFAHATIKTDDEIEVHGIILLPDNFQRPEGISLKTSKEMGMEWDESWLEYIREDYDGYAQNIYTEDQWLNLEFFGAVFLPAAGLNGSCVNVYGWYWSSSEKSSESDKGYSFAFGRDNVEILFLKTSPSPKTDNHSIRLVRAVK